MKHSVRFALLIRFGILVILTLIATVIGFMGLRRLNNANDHLAQVTVPALRAAGDINTNTSDFRVAELRYLNALTEDVRVRFKNRMDELFTKMDTLFDNYTKLIETQEEKLLYQKVLSLWEEYIDVHEEIMRASADGSDEGIYQARVILNESTNLYDELTAACLDLQNYNQQLMTLAQESSTSMYQESSVTVAKAFPSLQKPR